MKQIVYAKAELVLDGNGVLVKIKHLKDSLITVSLFFIMKYYYEPSDNAQVGAGEIYICDHPLFNKGTLFRIGSKGLIIVQEHYNKKTKARWWGPVVPWLSYDIYTNSNFASFFEKTASECDENGLFPVISVRKVMWALRMKPLRKELWENGF